MGYILRVFMFCLFFHVYIFSLGNLFFSSILAEAPDPRIVLVEFWIRLGCFISWILSFTLRVNNQSQVRINLRNRLLRSLCRRRRHAVVGHRKQRRHKIMNEYDVKRPDWGSYPLLTPPNPSYDPKSSYPAQVFSRLLDDSRFSEFMFTDFFHRSSLPLTSKQAARACVALTSDLKLTAASATCTRNQAVLFVRGWRTPIIFDTGATTNVSNDPSDFINWEREGDCGAIDGLTGQTRIKGIGTVQWTFRTESNKIYKFKTKALFVPDCNIKLLSPQAVFQEQGSGSFSINQEGAVFVFPNSSE